MTYQIVQLEKIETEIIVLLKGSWTKLSICSSRTGIPIFRSPAEWGNLQQEKLVI